MARDQLLAEAQRLKLLAEARQIQAGKSSYRGEPASVAGGAYRGIINSLFGIGDLANAGVNKGLEALGSDYRLDMPTEIVKDAVDSRFTPTRSEPRTTAGRVAGRAAEEVGAFLLPTAGAVAAAPKIGKAADSITGTIIKSVGDAPVLSGAMAAGGGAAAGATKEVTDNPWAELGALLLGSLTVGGIAGGGRAVVEGVKGVAEPFTKSGRERIVGSVINDSRIKPIDGDEIISGSRPTTANAAQDPGLATIERGLQSSSPSAAAQFEARKAGNAAARMKAIDGIEAPNGGADALADGIRERLSRFEGATDEIVDSVTRKAAARVQEMGSDVTPEQAGQIIREEYDSALLGMKGRVSDAFESVDPDGAVSIPGESIQDDILKAADKYFGEGAGEPPDELKAIISELTEDSLSYTRLQNVRSRALEYADKAGLSGDRRAAALAGDIADSIVKRLDSELPADQSAAWSNARSLRAEQRERFETGASGRVGKTKSRGETIGDAQTIQAYFNKGVSAKEDAESFISALGGSDRARKAVEGYVASEVRKYASRADGTLDPKRVRRWVLDHRAALDSFPDIRKKLQSAETAESLVESVSGKQSRAISEVEKSAAGLFLKDDPEKAVAKILGGRNPAADLGRIVTLMKNDKDALAGLRRSVLDHIVNKAKTTETDLAGNTVLSNAGFSRQITGNLKALKTVFPEAQVKAIQRIAEDMARDSFSATAGKAVGSNTTQNLSTANFIYRMSSGVIDPSNPIAASVARPATFLFKLPEQSIQDLLLEAMLDPKLAASLAGKATPKRLETVLQRLEKLGERTGGRITAIYGANALNEEARQ